MSEGSNNFLADPDDDSDEEEVESLRNPLTDGASYSGGKREPQPPIKKRNRSDLTDTQNLKKGEARLEPF